MKSKMMTVQEVASLLRISRFSVYKLVRRGDLPATRILNKLRFESWQIRQYLKRQRV